MNANTVQRKSRDPGECGNGDASLSVARRDTASRPDTRRVRAAASGCAASLSGRGPRRAGDRREPSHRHSAASGSRMDVRSRIGERYYLHDLGLKNTRRIFLISARRRGGFAGALPAPHTRNAETACPDCRLSATPVSSSIVAFVRIGLWLLLHQSLGHVLGEQPANRAPTARRA